MKRIFCIIICYTCVLISANSQNMVIRSVAMQPSDKTAVKYPCLDVNNDTCALIKIKTDNLEGIQFTNHNQFIKVSYVDGIYMVYLPALSRKLDFQHKDYMPVQLDMANYGFKKLRNGKTYLVVLDAPKHSDMKSSVILKVEPQSALVSFDDIDLSPSTKGTYEIPVNAGSHSYSIKLDNYKGQSGTLSIGKTEVKTLSLRLMPITHEVLIGCNINKARVFIDNVDYGQIGRVFIPQGQHKIRVQADGYVDSEKIVNVVASMKPLSFILKENKRVKHIHATPVTIISKSSIVYKNNKQIKEWSNGTPVMFMPGKYLISDDLGNTKKIVVGTEPLEVNL